MLKSTDVPVTVEKWWEFRVLSRKEPSGQQYITVSFLLRCFKQPLQKGTGLFQWLTSRTEMDG